MLLLRSYPLNEKRGNLTFGLRVFNLSKRGVLPYRRERGKGASPGVFADPGRKSGPYFFANMIKRKSKIFLSFIWFEHLTFGKKKMA